MSLILLHPNDNVLVVTAPVARTETVTIDDVEIVAALPLAVGHKVARIGLQPGDKIYKYGAPIGSMTEPARPGDHIHLHNMKSDYIASHTRETLERSQSR